ncbi:MAG TPA: hypothetical protein DHW02_09075, partial [Ktedonobacter sp.]|nr:hypothetical protein [Ktedonobacter sp.]
MAGEELPQIGPYITTKLLGVSSTSRYYLSKSLKSKRDAVHIKLLSVPLESAEAKYAFMQRVKQLKKLSSSRNVVAVQDGNLHGDFGYLVLDAVSGETMHHMHTPGKQLPLDEAKRVLSPLADALNQAHVSNIVHGNLHPGNISLSLQHQPLLTEFSLTISGITPLLDDEAFAIPYMSPEQLRGQAITPASDQYALAVMLYEWLCGRRPYDATERDMLVEQQERSPLPLPSTLNSAIKPAIEQVLLQALSFAPEKRYANVHLFSTSYLHALMGLPAPTLSKERPITEITAKPFISTTPVSPVATSSATSVSSATASTPMKKQSVNTVAPVLASSTSMIIERAAKSNSNTLERAESPKTQPASLKKTSKIVEPKSPLQENVPQQTEKKSKEFKFPSSSSESSPSSEQLQATVTHDLRHDGVLSQRLPGYEERVAQIEMATLVSRSLMQGVPSLIEAGTGTGKALDVDTPIPTPTGWKRMGDLVAGDVVFDEKGQPTCVKIAFGVLYDRSCYEVEFSDGSTLIADAEHEWLSYTAADRKRTNISLTSTYTAKNFITLDKLAKLDSFIAIPSSDETLSVSEAVALIGGHHWSVQQAAYTIIPFNQGKRRVRYPRQALLTLVRERLARDLIEQRRDRRMYSLVTTEEMANTLTIGSAKRANHAIPVTNPLSLPDVELPIAPYFLGFWLGDGNSNNNQITTADPDIITEIEKDGYTVRSIKSHPYLYAVDDENGKARSRWQPGMTGRLRTLGVLHNKHIPTIYLRASEQQRRALLAGLLDTDGTVSHSGAIEFTTTNPQLAQDTYELMCSLGFRPTQRAGRSKYSGKDCGPKWTLSFTTNEQVFRLKRKQVMHEERLRNYSSERNRFRYVIAVREVASRPVRCIQVDAESHLYLAGRSMIPTHNSLAYLVPAVRSGKVAIVSTANKALQEQLFYKDIPFVQQHIKDFEAALVKGVSNYVCLDRLESERVGMQFYAKNTDFKRLVDITNDPDAEFTGDFETLGFQLSSDIRSKVATDSDQCAWSKCGYFADCYVRQMRENAERAQVIVVNHTLLLLDAAMGGFLLPERDVIILDEAHHLEEEATRSFTITIGPNQIQTLLAQKLLRNHSQLSLQDEAMRISAATWMRLSQVADPGYKGRINLEAPLEEGLKLATVIGDLADSLRKQRPKDLPDKEGQLYDKLLKRTQNLSENIRTVFSVAQPTQFVYYVERVQTGGGRASASNVQLQVSAAPLDVTNWLKERLFDKCNVICTSATLATIGPDPAHPEVKGPNFSYFRKRIGLDALERPDVLECILPLAFDYENNSLLYIPRDLPAPAYGAGSDEYMKSIAREMYKLVKASRGRAFLLFSSKRMLDRAYELMSPHLPYPLLKQGDMTRLELTRRFREEEGSVLFGLKSFWEGVDIAGEALSLVVIDKLPFDPPDDPVHEARVAQM